MGDVEYEAGMIHPAYREAVEATGKLHAVRDFDSLCRELHDMDEMMRCFAAEALGKLGDPRAIEPLSRALRDPNWNVRVYAIEALGVLGDSRAFDPLLRCMKDKDYSVRQAAIKVLGEIGGYRALPSLIAALDEEYLFVRQTALLALGKIGDLRAFEPICMALRSDDARMRLTAAKSLGFLASIRPDPVLKEATPILRRLARGAEDRDAYQKALEMIEEETRSLLDLPAPSTMTSPSDDSLPIPADSQNLSNDATSISMNEDSRMTLPRRGENFVESALQAFSKMIRFLNTEIKINKSK